MISYFSTHLRQIAYQQFERSRVESSPALQDRLFPGRSGWPGRNPSLLPRLDRPYGISAFVGVLTYCAYGSLNDAWGNPALFAIALYMFLCIPGYSKLSNQVEAHFAQASGLETVGRLSRYGAQLGVNLILLWAFLAGEVLDPSGITELGGFFAAAAWVTVISQGGQYIATWLAQQGLGRTHFNVVLAISASAVVNALAVSGVPWIQPVYLAVSLSIGMAILIFGVLSDAQSVLRKGRESWPQSDM